MPQEFNLIGTMTVFENIYLGSELVRGGLLDKGAMRKRTTALLDELNADISPDAKVDDLGVAQKQMVEIAKALIHDSKILILDEPTTVLTETGGVPFILPGGGFESQGGCDNLHLPQAA